MQLPALNAIPPILVFIYLFIFFLDVMAYRTDNNSVDFECRCKTSFAREYSGSNLCLACDARW